MVMGLNVSHKAMSDDVDRLDVAARRFAQRHGIVVDEWWVGEGIDAPDQVSGHVDDLVEQHDDKRLARLWRRCVIRALRGRGDTIAYGYVGWANCDVFSWRIRHRRKNS